MNINPVSETINAASGLANSILTGLDKLLTSDDERLKARAIIEAQVQMFMVAMEGELSRRHEADMVSDNVLSKNIRPAILIVLTLAFFVFVGLDVKAAHVEAITTLLQTAFGFYFGFRGIEKSVSLFNRGK